MGAQVGKAAAVIESVGLLQLFEHAHKALGRKPRLRHHAKADPVGLALHVARKVELALHRRRLPAHDQSVGTLAVAGALASGQDAQNHGAHHPWRLGALLRHIARNVALGNVAELVAQHRGQLVARADNAHQPQMHAKVAPRQGEGVDRAVAPEQHLPGKGVDQLGRHLAARYGRRQQRLPDALQVLHGDRVVHVIGVAVEAAGNAVAQAPLGSGRHFGAVTQVRQGVARRRVRSPWGLRLHPASGPGQGQRQPQG